LAQGGHGLRRVSTLKVDLHMHTTISDGRLTPDELVHAIAASGLDYFSITDHDTLGMYLQHSALLAKFQRKLINGVEVSTFEGGREVHILGYGMPISPATLSGVLTDRRETRRGRAVKILEKLREMGVNIAMEDVERQTKGGMIGRPHIARALVESRAARDISDAFDRYIGSNCPAFFPSSTLTAAKAIQAINESGGVSVLAHPTRNAAEELLESLLTEGLQGIEAYSTSHTPHDAERLRAKAHRYNLVMTAGTDFHAPTEANPQPGCEVEASDLRGFLDKVL
jgi:3',5'-nucleoside bisphosphate phosphatase